jgi:hypothetical protein
LPESSQIQTVHVFVTQLSEGRLPPVQEFNLLNHFDQLLDALKPNRADAGAAKWESGGELTIAFRQGGERMKIEFFWPQGDALGFRLFGKYYRGGSKNKIKALFPNSASK